MTESPVKEGDVLAGKYRVERTLGVGGMGVVVAARHIQLEDQVALKFLLPSALENAELVARFQREARAAVKIKGEHVAKVLDVGTMDSGAPYMVMEFLQGGDLEQLLERKGTCPVDESVDYIMQACEAMAEAHALGIIHRDLKPANLFLSQRADGTPIVKVLDFGISKALKPGEDASVTKTTAVMGSPLYMSPEQLRASRNVDVRSDIWSLGVILYELLMGTPPFLAPTMPQLCAVILSEPPIPLNPDLPEPLQQAIMKCLAKDPVDRYPSVAAFTADIIRYGSPSSRSNFDRITRITEASGVAVPIVDWAKPVETGGFPAAGRSTSTAWSDSKSGPQSFANTELMSAPAKGKGAKIGAALGVAALAALALVVGLRGSGGEQAKTEPPPVNPAAALAPAALAPAAVEKKVAVSIHSSAAGAKIFVDEVAVANPYLSQLVQGSTHQVRVEAPGHKTKSVSLVTDKDTTLDVPLESEETAEVAGGSKKGGHAAGSKKPDPKKPEPKPAAKPGGLTLDTNY